MNLPPVQHRRLPAVLQWTPSGGWLVLILAATSIWSLLFEMYALFSMRTFTLVLMIPAMLALFLLAMLDRLCSDGRLWRAVIIGTLAGLAGAIAYDTFRLPFVFSKPWDLEAVVPPMPLFKVFPRFGAVLLGEPLEQPSYSIAAHLVGWTYHFSNGATFGVMFAALLGGAALRYRCGWLWAIVMAVGIEACMLVSPYPKYFSIVLNTRFVTVTLFAHLIFGAAMGLYFAWYARAWTLPHTARP